MAVSDRLPEVFISLEFHQWNTIHSWQLSWTMQSMLFCPHEVSIDAWRFRISQIELRRVVTNLKRTLSNSDLNTYDSRKKQRCWLQHECIITCNPASLWSYNFWVTSCHWNISDYAPMLHMAQFHSYLIRQSIHFEHQIIISHSSSEWASNFLSFSIFTLTLTFLFITLVTIVTWGRR